jgi:iron complex transport system substrate-binding protein
MRTLLFAVCVALASDARAGIRVVDDAGAAIVLPAPARRIVSLAPHATELLFAAGAGERIVGVVKGSNHPAEARALPVIGDVHAIDVERIVALRPDLVVTWPYTTPAQVAKLAARGVAVFTTDPATIDGIATDIERLGTLAGAAPAAALAARRYRDRVADATSGAAGREKVRVFYQIWGEPTYTIGGRHLISQAIAACGGENVFGSLALPAPQVSVEAVIAARPQAIVAGVDGAARPAWLDAWSHWTGVPAVRDRQLHVVDADRLHRPGPRFAEGVAELCAAIDRARYRYRGTNVDSEPAASRASGRP